MGQNEGEALHPPPPVQGRVEEHQRKPPLQYMPYMEEHFYAATGLRLNGLSNFTGWIKWGSYYHGLVARQGQLHKCPHLVGVALPRWPQVTPSESCWVSQKKVKTPATSSSVPSTGASKAQET